MNVTDYLDSLLPPLTLSLSPSLILTAILLVLLTLGFLRWSRVGTAGVLYDLLWCKSWLAVHIFTSAPPSSPPPPPPPPKEKAYMLYPDSPKDAAPFVIVLPGQPIPAPGIAVGDTWVARVAPGQPATFLTWKDEDKFLSAQVRVGDTTYDVDQINFYTHSTFTRRDWAHIVNAQHNTKHAPHHVTHVHLVTSDGDDIILDNDLTQLTLHPQGVSFKKTDDTSPPPSPSLLQQ